jgi:hypothetical protein
MGLPRYVTKKAMKKLQEAFDKYDLEATNPKTGKPYDVGDPDSPFLDDQAGAEQAYEMVMSDRYFRENEDMGDFLNDVLGGATNYMEFGAIDDIIDVFTKREKHSYGDPNEPPDIFEGAGSYEGTLKSYIDDYTSRFDGDQAIAEKERYMDALVEALTYYRDNWLGYHANDILEQGVNRAGDIRPSSTPKNQSLGVLKSDGVAPAAPQGPTGVLADTLGYPKIPGGMDAAQRQPIPGGVSGRRDMQGRFRHQPPQEQAFEELLKQLGLLHQY